MGPFWLRRNTISVSLVMAVVRGSVQHCLVSPELSGYFNLTSPLGILRLEAVQGSLNCAWKGGEEAGLVPNCERKRW